MQIGILSTLQNDLLPHYLQKLQFKKYLKIHVIFSDQSKKSIEKDKKIFFERTKGYFQNLKLSDLKNENINYYFVNDHNSKSTLKLIKNKKLDFLFNGGVIKRIDTKILKSTKGIVNIHPGILPYYRGCNCVEWAVLNGDIVGNTSHFMEKHYDSGPIIMKSKLNLKSCYSYENLRIKVYKNGINLCSKTFDFLRKKNFKKKLVIQEHTKSFFYKLMSKKDIIKVKNKISINHS